MGNRRILIDSLPESRLSVSNYRLEMAQMPEPGNGEALCRTLILSIDAGARAGLQKGGLSPGQVMPGGAIVRVEKSNDSGIAEGAIAICASGWQEYSVQTAKTLNVIRPDIDVACSHYLGALGHSGLTAYFGLSSVANLQAGETVAISAASGAVGHIAGQLARIRGCRVIGMAGSLDKCARLVEELGFAAAVNYKDPEFAKLFECATPNGIDVFFDNTGGPILDAALSRMNRNGRICCCGTLSQYDTNDVDFRPKEIPRLLIRKRIRMEGFLVSDYADGYAEAQKTLTDWLKSGELKAWQDEFQGLERAPEAFVDMLSGGNAGKRIVRVSD